MGIKINKYINKKINISKQDNKQITDLIMHIAQLIPMMHAYIGIYLYYLYDQLASPGQSSCMSGDAREARALFIALQRRPHCH